jgi:hypothetical protein
VIPFRQPLCRRVGKADDGADLRGDHLAVHYEGGAHRLAARDEPC